MEIVFAFRPFNPNFTLETKVMKIKQLFAGIMPIVDGDTRKKQTAKAVLKGPITHNGVLNIHRHDPNNVGDFYCAPHLYFPELHQKVLDIGEMRKTSPVVRRQWAKSVRSNDLIIGGGGLLNLPHFQQQMQLFAELGRLGKKTVLWGPGHNDPDFEGFKQPAQYQVDLNSFGMVGLRDYSAPGTWVPCVSCLHPIFDQKVDEIHEVGVLLGKKSANNPQRLEALNNLPTSHNATDLKAMVEFIGQCNTLITDSYHAMYWALLMERKVVVIPTTTKFLDFKYPVPVSDFNNFKSVLSKAVRYTGILEECRDINTAYAKKVFDYLEIEPLNR
jgi:hypothetical protein